MRTRRSPIQLARLLAIFALFALVATACGSGGQTSTAERALDIAPAPADSGPEYGATLEEYGEQLAEPSQAHDFLVADTTNASAPSESGIATIAWGDLIPVGQSGAEVMTLFADRINEFEPGSPDALAVYEEMQAAFDPAAVNADLDGQEIRLAGFVAPLTYEGDIVTEFLLVPNFGACIHVPPPPPNQTIMVTVDKEYGLTPDEAWGAVWVEGTITVAATTTDLAEASYTISGGKSGVYDEF